MCLQKNATCRFNTNPRETLFFSKKEQMCLRSANPCKPDHRHCSSSSVQPLTIVQMIDGSWTLVFRSSTLCVCPSVNSSTGNSMDWSAVRCSVWRFHLPCLVEPGGATRVYCHPRQLLPAVLPVSFTAPQFRSKDPCPMFRMLSAHALCRWPDSDVRTNMETRRWTVIMYICSLFSIAASWFSRCTQPIVIGITKWTYSVSNPSSGMFFCKVGHLLWRMMRKIILKRKFILCLPGITRMAYRHFV
jgi:hypothetical protein